MKTKLNRSAVFSVIESLAGRNLIRPILPICFLAVASAPAATITWTGAASVYWTNSANWSPPQVPTSTDTAVINSGNVTVEADSDFGTLNFTGGFITGPVVVRTNRVMNWSGGRLNQGSSLTVLGNGLVNLSTSTQKDLGGPLTNYGRIVLSGAGFNVLNNNSSWQGAVTNLGTWEIQGDFNLQNYYGNVYTIFGNSGVLRKTAGTGIGVFGTVLMNGPAAAVDVQSGTLRFDGGGRLDGTLTAAAGTVIDFHNGTFVHVPSSRFTGNGEYKLTGGTLQDLNDYLANLQLLGGTVYLSSTYQTNGPIVRLDLDGTTLAGTNEVSGVLNFNSGYISGSLTVNPNGVLNWSSGRFAQGSSLLVESDGVVNLITSAEKDMGGPMSNYGQVIWTGGSLYVMNDNNTWLGTVVNLGVWEMQGDLTLAQYFGNDLATFVNGGKFRKTAGTGSGIINLPFLNAAGIIEAWTGRLRFDHGQQLDGTFAAQAGGVIDFHSGTFSYTPATWLVGPGSFQLTGGILLGLPDSLPNLQLLGGTVNLSPFFQTNGSIVQLDLDGATLAGVNQVSGVLNFNSGHIAGPVTVSSNGVLNWNGGRFAQGSSLVVVSNGLVNIQGGTGKELGGALTNYGTVSWTGGNLGLMNDGGSWAGTIENFGLWDISGNMGISRYYGNDYPVFVNNGVLRKSAGTGTSTLDLLFLNQAVIEPLSGLLTFNRGLSCTEGGVTFGMSGPSSYGRVSVTGTASVTGGLGARLLGGYIPDAGQNFPVLTAGTLAGTFTNTGGLKVGFGRVLSPVYTPTSLTLQTAVTNGVNTAPTWTAVPNFSILEGQTLLYTNQVNDPDGNQVLFQLLSAPSGAVLDLTTGILTWTPTEAQGGTSNYFRARIFDSGNPSLGSTQSFSVLVVDTNTAPVLPVIPAQLIGVGGTLTVANTAVDTDVPANTLSYTLLAPPSGMTVNANGIITWSPTTTGSYLITMRVTDNGTPNLSATNSFTVGVIAQAAPPPGLVSWWSGDGTTADKNGLNAGALSGTASYGPGLFGQAFSFNGGYLTVLDSPSLDYAPGSAMTVEMWVKRATTGSVPYYFGKRVGCGSYNYQSPSDQFSVGTAYDVPIGEWRHFTWVFTGTEMLGYVNGALVYQTQATLGPTNSAALFIGTSGTCGSTFVGLMDEVRIYNRALSASEVRAVYGGQSVGAPVITQQPASQLAASGSTVTFSSAATGNAPLSYQWWYNGEPLPGRTTANLTLTGVVVGQSGNYTVAVSNALGTATSSTAELTIMDAPVITLQPQSQSAPVGGSVTLTAAASGGVPMSYQWRKAGMPLNGATATSLTLSGLQTTDAGNYDLVAFNWVGAATSHLATLTINSPIVWTGAASAYWTNPANWSPPQVPTSADEVVIGSGNVTFATNSQFAALAFTGGTITGPVTVGTGCVLNWSGGRLNQGSSLTVLSNGLVNLTTSTQKDLGGPLTNYGRVVLSGSGFNVLNNNSSWQGAVTNLGTWEIQGDFNLQNYFGNVYTIFGNSGVLRKTAGTGVGVMGPVLMNEPAGTVDVESGTLRFDGGGRLDGTFTAAEDSVMEFHNGTFTYVPSGRFTGVGDFELTGGTLQNLGDYLGNLQLLGGTVYLSPTYQTNGAIVRLDLDGATLAGANEVSGVLNFNSGYISGSLTVNPNGALNWSGGRFAQGSSLLVQSDGVVNLMSNAEKDMGGPMSNYGQVIWTGGVFYVLNDNNTWLGTVVNLGVWEMQGDLTLAQYFGNDDATFENGGNFLKTAGTGNGTINLPFYNPYGAVEVWSGTLRFDHGQQLDGLFTADEGTTIELQGGVFSYTPPGRFTGNGLYKLTGGTLNGLTDFLPNWQFAGGTVNLSPFFQTNGSIVQLDLDGATLAGANEVSGVLNFNSGYISGPLTVNSNAVLNWNGGRFAQGSSLLVTSNGFVNIQGPTGKELGGALTNYGTVSWTGGTITVMNDGGNWAGSIRNFGLWDTLANLTLNRWFANDYAVFQNQGLLRKSGGAGNSQMDLIVTNQAGVEALSGSMSFTRGLSCAGGDMTFGISNNTTFGRVSVTGTVSVSGGVGARLLNGYIPDEGQGFQVISAGTLAGTFTNTDGLSVGFGRVLTPLYTATALTLQAAATNGLNNPPAWTAVPNFSILEGETLLYTNQVTDPEGDQVLFQLLSAPTGAELNLTNGILSWTPTDAQGGTSNYLTARIFDSGNPSLGSTQSFYVLVAETNSAPALPVIEPQLVGIGGVLTVTNTATDADLPPNTLTYSLLTAPAGMHVDANGVITWAPSTPGNYQVRMRVADNGVPPLSATNSFTVGVIPQAPPPPGLVSWWSADGTTADRNGLNDGSLTGNANYGAGLFGQAFSLNGGYLAVPDSVTLDFPPGSPMTVEMWVKATQDGSVPYYFGKRVGCGSYNYESPSDLVEGESWIPAVGQWQHLAWVFTGTEMQAYVNGALVYQMSTVLGPINTVPLFIGASGTCGQTFVGFIDEVRLYNRALNAAEVQGIYAGQSVGAPVLTQQPASQLVASGTTVTLTSSATGAAPLSYQWWYNGTPLPGQNSASLTMMGVVVAQSGDYSVVVSNALGVVTSDVAGLTILDAPVITLEPQSQVGVVGGSVTFTVAATGTPTPSLTYQWRKDGAPLSGATSTALTLNNLQVSDAGSYDVVVANWVGTATSQAAPLYVSTPIVWTGLVSSDWDNPANWAPQQVPTSADTAVINSGNVTFANDSVFFALSLNGGNISGPVVVGTDSLMYWNGGRLTQNSSLTVLGNAVLYLTGSADKWLGGPMTNFGRVILSGSGFTVLNNNSTWLGGVTNMGMWEIQGDLNIQNYYGNVYTIFGNSGTLRKTTGPGVGIVGPVLMNGLAGMVDVESGTLRFDGGGRLDGTFAAAEGTVMDFHNGTFAFVPPSRFTGSGEYRLTGGTLDGLDDYLANLQLLGGTVNLSPTYQTNGLIVRLDLNGATLGGTSNRVVGVLNAVGGSISGALEVAPNAVANLDGTSARGFTALRANSTLNWYGGRFAQGSSLLVEATALVNLLGNAEKDMGGPMTNNGHVVMSGGNFFVMNDNSSWQGSVTNLGTWEMEGDFTVGQYFGNDAASFYNGGVFRKTAGTAAGVINLPFFNAGTVEVQTGTLRFDHGMRLDGTFVAAAGAVIAFHGGDFVFVPPAHFTGGGLYQLTGGTLQGLDNYLPNLQLLGGTVYLSPIYQTNGLIVRLDLSGATLAGSHQVVGMLNATNGSISGALDIAETAVANLSGTWLYGPTIVRSNATFNWLGGRFAPGSSLLVQSNALLNLVTTAEKDLGGPMTNYGRVVWSGGPFYLINDNNTYLGAVTNLGIWDMQGDVGMSQWYNNDAGAFVNRGTFRKTAGTGVGVVNLPFVNTLGIIDVSSGTLRFDHGQTLDGLFVAGTGAAIQFHNGTFLYTAQTRLTGGGGYQLTGGTLQDLADYLPNLQLLGGNVSLSPTYQTNGTIVRLDLNGATLVGTNRVTGVMNLVSGYIGGQLIIGANGVLNWSSGRLAQGSSLMIESNGVANLMTAGVKEVGGPFANAGQVLWTGGTMTLLNDASSWKGAIVNSGIWETRGDLSMGQYWVNNYSSFQNTGTLRKPTGTGTATMDVVFQNQGVIEQLSGIWTFGRNFSLTGGTVLFGLAGDTDFGRINLTGTASLAGSLAARLLNGYVPATNRTFQVMSYGVVAGTFTDYSGLDVGSGRAFAPVYTSNSLILQTYATNSTVHPTPIVLSNPRREPAGFSFLFTGDIGSTYTVQYCTNFTQPIWTTLLVTNIPVSPAKVTDPEPPVHNRFYRVLRNDTASIVLSDAKRDGSQFSFLFTGDIGTSYTIQYSTNLTQPIWTTLLVTNIPASPAKVTSTITPALNHFYRVMRNP